MQSQSRPDNRKKPRRKSLLKKAYIQVGGGFLSKEDRKRLYNEDEE